MSKTVNHILLIDDNKIDNFFHERIIKKYDPQIKITTLRTAYEALDFIQSQEEKPNIIFLDINMPGMSGWEFLDEYKKLKHLYQDVMIVVMLTTSENPDDKARALTHGMLSDFRSKPLTLEILKEVIEKFHQSK
ncbi:response regulator [Flavobacterium sp. RHBU_24]|uniref:response regulator n=1 Tax=Flavobacterium sp. RHBU_24 TaxID=3391185 RepID=UPI003984E365